MQNTSILHNSCSKQNFLENSELNYDILNKLAPKNYGKYYKGNLKLSKNKVFFFWYRILKRDKNLLFTVHIIAVKKFYIISFPFDEIKQGLIKKGNKTRLKKILGNVSLVILKDNYSPKAVLRVFYGVMWAFSLPFKLKERKTRRFTRYSLNPYMDNKIRRYKNPMCEVVKSLKHDNQKKILIEKFCGTLQRLKDRTHTVYTKFFKNVEVAKSLKYRLV